MSERKTLASLVARCEAATEHNRQLNWDITAAMNPGKSASMVMTQDYTGSLDAAVTLVPDGWTGMIHLDGKASLYRDDREPPRDGSAITPALALCAAALRARMEAMSNDR